MFSTVANTWAYIQGGTEKVHIYVYSTAAPPQKVPPVYARE